MDWRDRYTGQPDRRARYAAETGETETRSYINYNNISMLVNSSVKLSNKQISESESDGETGETGQQDRLVIETIMA